MFGDLMSGLPYCNTISERALECALGPCISEVHAQVVHFHLSYAEGITLPQWACRIIQRAKLTSWDRPVPQSSKRLVRHHVGFCWEATNQNVTNSREIKLAGFSENPQPEVVSQARDPGRTEAAFRRTRCSVELWWADYLQLHA